MSNIVCGNCEHWQPANPKERFHGECCKDVPYWAFEETGSGTRRFVNSKDTGAMHCDCYLERREQR
jgi:hypothetical protein